MCCYVPDINIDGFLRFINFAQHNDHWNLTIPSAGQILNDPAVGSFLRVTSESNVNFQVTGLQGMFENDEEFTMAWDFNPGTSATSYIDFSSMGAGGVWFDGHAKISNSGFGPPAGDPYGQWPASCATGHGVDTIITLDVCTLCRVNLSPRFGWFALAPINPGSWNEMALTFTPRATGYWDWTLTVNGRTGGGGRASGNVDNLTGFQWAIFPWSGTGVHAAQKDFANIRIFAGTVEPGPGQTPGPLPIPPPLAPADYFVTVFGDEHTSFRLTHEYGIVGAPAPFAATDSRLRFHATDWVDDSSRFRFFVDGVTFTNNTDYVVEWQQFVSGSDALDVRFWYVAEMVNPWRWTLMHYGVRTTPHPTFPHPTFGDPYGQVAAGLTNLSPSLPNHAIGGLETLPFNVNAWNHIAVRFRIADDGSVTYSVSVNGRRSADVTTDTTAPPHLMWEIRPNQKEALVYLANISISTDDNGLGNDTVVDLVHLEFDQGYHYDSRGLHVNSYNSGFLARQWNESNASLIPYTGDAFSHVFDSAGSAHWGTWRFSVRYAQGIGLMEPGGRYFLDWYHNVRQDYASAFQTIVTGTSYEGGTGGAARRELYTGSEVAWQLNSWHRMVLRVDVNANGTWTTQLFRDGTPIGTPRTTAEPVVTGSYFLIELGGHHQIANFRLYSAQNPVSCMTNCPAACCDNGVVTPTPSPDPSTLRIGGGPGPSAPPEAACEECAVLGCYKNCIVDENDFILDVNFNESPWSGFHAPGHVIPDVPGGGAPGLWGSQFHYDSGIVADPNNIFDDILMLYQTAGWGGSSYFVLTNLYDYFEPGTRYTLDWYYMLEFVGARRGFEIYGVMQGLPCWRQWYNSHRRTDTTELYSLNEVISEFSFQEMTWHRMRLDIVVHDSGMWTIEMFMDDERLDAKTICGCCPIAPLCWCGDCTPYHGDCVSGDCTRCGVLYGIRAYCRQLAEGCNNWPVRIDNLVIRPFSRYHGGESRNTRHFFSNVRFYQGEYRPDGIDTSGPGNGACTCGCNLQTCNCDTTCVPCTECGTVGCPGIECVSPMLLIDFSSNPFVGGGSMYRSLWGGTTNIVPDANFGQRYEISQAGRVHHFIHGGFLASNLVPGNTYVLDWYYRVNRNAQWYYPTLRVAVNPVGYPLSPTGHQVIFESARPLGDTGVANPTDPTAPFLNFVDDQWHRVAMRIVVNANRTWSVQLYLDGVAVGGVRHLTNPVEAGHVFQFMTYGGVHDFANIRLFRGSLLRDCIVNCPAACCDNGVSAVDIEIIFDDDVDTDDDAAEDEPGDDDVVEDEPDDDEIVEDEPIDDDHATGDESENDDNVVDDKPDSGDSTIEDEPYSGKPDEGYNSNYAA